MIRHCGIFFFAILVLFSLILVSACGSGGQRKFSPVPYSPPGNGGESGSGATGTDQPTPPPPSQHTDEPGNIETFFLDVVDPSLPAWDDPQRSALAGNIVILGLQLEIPDENYFPTAPEQQPAGLILTRIIDDEDNIGSTQYPDDLGDFFHADLEPGYGMTFNLVAQVEDDLNGDGLGHDIIDLRIPVNLAAGKVTELFITLSPVEPERYLFESGADQPFGIILELAYNYNGPEGTRTKHQAINFATGKTVLDMNGDRFYEPLDFGGDDSNSDGIYDNAPPLIPPGGIDADFVTLEGFVIEYAPGLITIKPEFEYSEPKHIFFDPRTAIMSPLGFELHPGEIRPGHFVLVQGFIAPGDKLVAITIIVFPPPNEQPPWYFEPPGHGIGAPDDMFP